MEIIKQEQFDSAISTGFTVVDFYADWCGPCKMLGPVLEEVSQDYKDVKFIKVNVDEAEDIAVKFRIMSIPAVFMFKDGQVANKFVGFHAKEEVVSFVEETLKK